MYSIIPYTDVVTKLVVSLVNSLFSKGIVWIVKQLG